MSLFSDQLLLSSFWTICNFLLSGLTLISLSPDYFLFYFSLLSIISNFFLSGLPDPFLSLHPLSSVWTATCHGQLQITPSLTMFVKCNTRSLTDQNLIDMVMFFSVQCHVEMGLRSAKLHVQVLGVQLKTAVSLNQSQPGPARPRPVVVGIDKSLLYLYENKGGMLRVIVCV